MGKEHQKICWHSFCNFKLKLHSNFEVSYLLFSLVLIICSNNNPFVEGSSRTTEDIPFENGLYNDIILAIDPNKISERDCSTILNNINKIIPEFSNSLWEVTNGRAAIGKVNVFLPHNWTWSSSCGLSNVSSAPPHYDYKTSHILLTQNHPLASTLPWTRQYKPCGQEGDSIILPLSFLLSNPPEGFTDKIKGRLFLHEWTKFRYGAFDEIGYDDGDSSEEFLSPLHPCYSYDGQAQFTSCSGSQKLPSVALKRSACSLDSLEKQKSVLLKELHRSNASVMSSPFLDNVNQYCSLDNHNIWANTKQNIFCYRKSVKQVVDSHRDFIEQGSATTPHSLAPPSPPIVEIMQHGRLFKSAYAFVIDNSRGMQEEHKILHVKHAIAQFLEIVEFGAEIHVTIFLGDTILRSESFQVDSPEDKAKMLSFIPDSYVDVYQTRSFGRRLLPIFESVIEKLSEASIFAWNVLLFADATDSVDDMSSAIHKWSETGHSLSIFTFESESVTTPGSWLNWYHISNTLNVMALPYCSKASIQGPCSVQTAVFIVNHLNHLLSRQVVAPRFIQKQTPVVIANNGTSDIPSKQSFLLEGSPSNVKNVYFFFLSPELKSDVPFVVKLFPPSGAASSCNGQPLLGFEGVVSFFGDNCKFHEGTWTLQLDRVLSSSIPILHLDIFVEYEETSLEDRLIATPALGEVDLTNGIQPNSDNFTSLFLHLTTPEGNPVLRADVKVQVYYPVLMSSGEDYGSAIELQLRDNGDSGDCADLTENDGTYSGYLNGFSKTAPSFHLLSVKIKTGPETLVLESIVSPNASFVDNRLKEKCCGIKIHPRVTRALRAPAPLKFHILHLGFKTIDIWTKTSFPPETIKVITKAEENESSITIRFIAVKGDYFNDDVKVKEIHACCVGSTQQAPAEKPPSPKDCRPRTVNCGDEVFMEHGEVQSCLVNKRNLVNTFLSNSGGNKWETQWVSLICGLRPFNTNNEAGDISHGFFDFDLTDDLLGEVSGEKKAECEKWADGCLPMWIFWVMIGCLGVLLIVVIILAIGWIYYCKRKRNPNLQQNKKRNKKDSQISIITPPTPPQSKKEATSVYNPSTDAVTPRRENQNAGNNCGKAGEEGTVQYTSVTCSSRAPSPNTDVLEEPKVVKELYINHAYIQDEDGQLKIIADNGKLMRKPVVNEISYTPVKVVPITSQQPHPKYQLKQSLPPIGDNDNMQIFKTEQMHKKQQHPFNYQQPQLSFQLQSQPVVSANVKPIHPKTRKMPSSSLENQHQRRRPQIIHQNPMLRSDSTQNINVVAVSPTRQPTSQFASVNRAGGRSNNLQWTRTPTTEAPHYMVPHSKTLPRSMGEGGAKFSREPIPSFEPPQIQRYPSTTTADSDGDVTLLERVPPPKFTKPPPYPQGSKLLSVSNRPAPSVSSTGSPPAFPPVPPPRFGQSQSIRRADGPANIPPVEKVPLPKKEAHLNLQMREIHEDEDDSDEWDDGDDHYVIGTSYA